MAELSTGAVFAGHRIEGIAGEGGMGIVYRATHLALDIPVAVKIIRPDLARDEDFRERFQRESRLAASLEHPNVLPVRHAGEEDGLLYITMRFVEGTDLRARLSSRGRLDPGEAMAILRQVAAALDAAHARGLVHRDVKPANVLLDTEGDEERAYLTDFGLTRHAGSHSGLTRSGQWVGTLDYVAPEQIEGKAVDGRADIYSLGCMFYEMLTGEIPYARESEVATMYAHLNDPPPTLSERRAGLPPALDAVVAKAMAKDRDERYESAGEFARAAADALSPQGRDHTVVGGVAPPATTRPPGKAPAPDKEAIKGAETRASQRPAARAEEGAGARGNETVASRTAPASVSPETRTSDAPGVEAGGRAPSRRVLVLGGLGLVLIAIVVVAVFALGGSDDGDDAAAQAEAAREAQANQVMKSFERAFSDEALASIGSLFAPGARYLYPGYPPTNPEAEYRDLFSTRDVKDYLLDVNSVDASGETVTVDATYDYATSGEDDRASGSIEMTLDEVGGELKISTVRPSPDLYVYLRIPKPPADLTVVARIGPGGPEVAREREHIAQKGRRIPVLLPLEPGATKDFDDAETVIATVTGKDGAGPVHFQIRDVGYPFAS